MEFPIANLYCTWTIHLLAMPFMRHALQNSLFLSMSMVITKRIS